KGQLGDVIDINIVAVSIAKPIVGEFVVLQRHLADTVGGSAAQDAVVVVVDVTASDREIGPLPANGSAVLIAGARSVGRVCAEELDVLDGDVVPIDDPRPFALGDLATGVDLWAAIHTLKSETVGGDGAHVAGIAAGGVDGDRVVLRRGG